MITAEDIKIMAERGESFNVDFKVAVPQKVRDITEEVCSFANGNNVPSDTKSTFRPKSSSKSLHIPKNLSPMGLLLSNSTMMSTSLSLVCSPLE